MFSWPGLPRSIVWAGVRLLGRCCSKNGAGGVHLRAFSCVHAFMACGAAQNGGMPLLRGTPWGRHSRWPQAHSPTFTRFASDPSASPAGTSAAAALQGVTAADDRLWAPTAGEGSREAMLPNRLPRFARMPLLLRHP